MDDPTKLMEDGMRETNEVLALRASVAEGKRLLQQCIEQRDAARDNSAAARGTERRLLQRITHLREWAQPIHDAWWFKFLPGNVKALVWRTLDD